jgi:hypothetical protein
VQLVGNDTLGGHALFLHQPGQQALGGLGVAARLNDFKHISVLINCPPEPVLPASDADDHLVQVPDVSRAWRLAAKAPGISGSELPTPPADRLVGYDDAAFEQHLLDQAQAQRKSEVQPDRVGDDLGWKAVTFVADGLGHGAVLTPEALTKSYRDITCFASLG